MMDLKKIYSDIKKRRIELGMTQGDLAELVQYKSRPAIARLESGDIDMPLSKLFAIAQALRIHPSTLINTVLDGDERSIDRQVSTTENQLLDYFNACDETDRDKIMAIARISSHPKVDIRTETYVEIPFFPLKNSNASLGVVASSREPLVAEPTSEAMQADYVLRTSGSSMSPTYPAGCYILIKTDNFSHPQTGDPVIAKVDSKVYFKIFHTPDELISVDPSFPPVKGKVECIGIVTGIANRVSKKGRIPGNTKEVWFGDKYEDQSSSEELPFYDSPDPSFCITDNGDLKPLDKA